MGILGRWPRSLMMPMELKGMKPSDGFTFFHDFEL
jgi:hypothetical protein